jgi:hypothetical protein
VIGGYVSRGSRAPELSGRYVFGDYCSGRIEALRESTPGNFTSQLVAQAPNLISSFGEGSDGRLYVISYDTLYELQTDPVPGAAVPANRPWQRVLLACALLALGASFGLRAQRARAA